MRFLRLIASFLTILLRAVVYDGPIALLAILRLTSGIIKAQCARQRRPENHRGKERAICVPINEPAFHRPDPLIYDQYYLLSLGLAVTWDNPDITLRRGDGTVVPSSALDTDYEIVAQIWNGSPAAPVVGLKVEFSYLSFGIGTVSHVIGGTTVNLGVKGGPDHPAFATMRWHTPATTGHYCLQVLLNWFDDINPYNNLGQENTQVGRSSSPADFAFELRNSTDEAQQVRFEIDSYVIPSLPACAPPAGGSSVALPPARSRPVVPQSVLDRHQRARFPLPPGWLVSIEPSAPALGVDEEITVHVAINPPDDFRGRQAININAFGRLGALGGVTLLVVR